MVGDRAQGVDPCGVDEERGVDLAGCELIDHRRRIRNEAHTDATQTRLAEMILRIRRQIDAVGAAPPPEDIRPRTHRRCAVIDMIEARVPREKVRRHDRIVAVTSEEVGDDRREGGPRLHDDGIGVWRVDRGDPIVSIARRNVVLRIHDRTVREDDVR